MALLYIGLYTKALGGLLRGLFLAATNCSLAGSLVRQCQGKKKRCGQWSRCAIRQGAQYLSHGGTEKVESFSRRYYPNDAVPQENALRPCHTSWPGSSASRTGWIEKPRTGFGPDKWHGYASIAQIRSQKSPHFPSDCLPSGRCCPVLQFTEIAGDRGTFMQGRDLTLHNDVATSHSLVGRSALPQSRPIIHS